MKPLSLSQEQKDKLLEMCKKLWPDASFHFWESDSPDYPDGMIGYNKYAVLGKHKTIHPALEIHWFEFCLTHLAKKISDIQIDNKNKYEDMNWIDSMYAKILLLYIHPVDYLYEQFLKLK